MKKILIYVLIAVLAVGATVGVILGVQSCKNKKDSASKLTTYNNVEYFAENQKQDRLAVIRVTAIGDDFTKVTYQFDTAAEVTFDADIAKYDEKCDLYDSKIDGKKYIDTGVVTLDMSALNAGKHILQVYVYNGTDKECIYEEVFIVKSASNS